MDAMQSAIETIEERGGRVYRILGEPWWRLYSDDTNTLASLGEDGGEVQSEESTPYELADWLGAGGIVDFLIEHGPALDDNDRWKLTAAIATGKAVVDE